MSQPLTQYFAHEAGEFLDQLDALVASSGRPDEVRLFRLARGVRGSAQLAGADAIAAVAEGLEEGARALRDGVLEWSDELVERVGRTIRDLRAFVERHERWSDADDRAALAAAERWAGVGEDRRSGARARDDGELTAFLRRELAGVTDELGRVLGELSARPDGVEPVRTVLRRMRPIRGLAGMTSLAPVLEVLEGVEDVAQQMLGRAGPATSLERQLLAAARDALDVSGRALESGEVPPDLPELGAFREFRDRAADREDALAALPVSRLFADGDDAPVVSSPMAPLHGAPASALEAFVAMEGTSFLDRAQGSLAASEGDPRRLARARREAADLALGVSELASLYGMAELVRTAATAAAAVGAADSAEAARAALGDLRRALPQPPAGQHGADEEELPSGHALPPPQHVEEGEAVPVSDLVYEPDDALREALGLRERVSALLAERDADAPLAEALDELFDLVALGVDGRG